MLTDPKSKCISLLIFILFCQIISAQRQNYICPQILRRALDRLDKEKYPNPCDIMQCETDLDPKQCPSGTLYEEEISMCGCCPGCVKYLGRDDACLPDGSPQEPIYDNSCNDPDNDLGAYCPIRKPECWPGTECLTATKKCGKPIPNARDSDCLYKKLSYQMGKLHWNPSCLEDGSYSPKQCKGPYSTGICFCVTHLGKRIFGRSLQTEAANMTCECSRRLSELKAEGIPATLHCSPNGNYEPIQCDKEAGICFCVDPGSGRPTGGVVPEDIWKELPCFNREHPGYSEDAHYLRTCESEWVAGQLMSHKASAHGTALPGIKRLNCDADGSYGHVQLRVGTERCVFKSGEPMEYFQKEKDAPIDCQCARDTSYGEIPGALVGCSQQTGNYPVADELGEQSFCFDSDGFNFAETPTENLCCLLGQCTDATMCEDQNGHIIIPKCPPDNVFEWEVDWTVPPKKTL